MVAMEDSLRALNVLQHERVAAALAFSELSLCVRTAQNPGNVHKARIWRKKLRIALNIFPLFARCESS
jgi:hypothetical protein